MLYVTICLTLSALSLYLPYEARQFINSNAKFIFHFQRGDKVVSSGECKTHDVSDGGFDIICDEKLVMEATMYKASEEYMVSTV